MKGHLKRYFVMFLLSVMPIGCSRSDHKAKVAIQVGDQEFLLNDLKDESSIRAEILSYVKGSWDSNGQTKTDWISVHSVIQGSETEADRALNVDSERPLAFASECVIPSFRLYKRNAQHLVVEVRDVDGQIRDAGPAKSSDWRYLEAILKPTLNDSILSPILAH